MGFYPRLRNTLLPTITPLSPNAIGAATNTNLGNLASAVYPVANRAYLYPFAIDCNLPVKALFCSNGSAGIPNDNVDVGIYSQDYKKIVSSGSVAQAGTDTAQVLATPANLELGAGEYYLAIVMNGTTGTLQRSAVTTAAILRRQHCWMMSSAFPLPATITPAVIAQAYIPIFGFLWDGTSFS